MKAKLKVNKAGFIVAIPLKPKIKYFESDKKYLKYLKVALSDEPRAG